jgi:O-antigen ligase
MPSFSASYDFGGYLMLSTLFLYALWSSRASRSAATVLSLAGGACLLLFAADSRSSMIGMAFAIGLDLFLRLRWQVVVAVMAVGAAAPYLVNSEKMERTLNIITTIFTSMNTDTLREAFLNDPSIRMRLRNWSVAIERWSGHPIAGEGLGSYLQYTEQYNEPGTPDGWYIRLLAESGLIGLLAFMLLVGGLLWTLFSAYIQETRPLPRAIVYGAALGVIAMLVNAFLIDSFVSYKIMGVFWMIVGVGTRVAVEGPARTAVLDSAAPALGSPTPDPTLA